MANQWRVRTRWLACALGTALSAAPATAQGLRDEESRLGPMPGALGPMTDAPGSQERILSGAPGPGFPRVSPDVTRPGGSGGTYLPPPSVPGLGRIREAPGIELPLFGTLELPEGPEPEGPDNGLTLDQAIARLIARNTELRAQAMEIPQSRADELTAGLRANPILFFDTQFIPYGEGFSEDNPGGPTEYNLNVTIPLDLNGKRRARAAYARRATRVLEAQYQNSVRLAIENLYGAYVDVLSARETVRYARRSVEGLEQLLEDTQDDRAQGEATLAEVERIRIQRNGARIGVFEAEMALREAKRELIPLLNYSPAQTEALQFRDPLAVEMPTPPPPETLVRMALISRPDLAAFRLGLKAAEAGVRLARAERYEDVFLLYQPFTLQDQRPTDQGISTSWALGVTVPLPLFNRNQGNIQRAQLNLVQTRQELAAREQLVVAEVLQAVDRLQAARYAVEQFSGDLLPYAQRVAADALERYRLGETDIGEYLNARRDLNDLVRQYRDALIRQRQSMLELNTAVGQRILP